MKKFFAAFLSLILLFSCFTTNLRIKAFAYSNLAAGKLPISSVPFTDIARITDGDKNANKFIDSTPNMGLQWVQLDLGASYNVNDIKLWHYFDNVRSYHDVIVQLSNNPAFSTGVTTVFNNDTDNSTGFGIGTDSEYIETSDGKDISFSAVSARYVRFYTNGNTKNGYNHYVEVEIYDRATNTPTPTPVTSSNLAAGKLPISSITFTDIARITDGDKNVNRYIDSAPNIGVQWVQLDLGASYNVNDIKLWHYYGDVRSYHDVVVRLSNNPDFSTGVTTVFNNDTDNSAGFGTGTDSEYIETSDGKDISFSAVNARYVRFYTNGNTRNGYNHYVEVEIYDGVTNIPTSTPVTSSNLAAYKLAISSVYFTGIGMMTDGDKNVNKYADSTPNIGLQWVQLDLGVSYNVNDIKLWHYYGDVRSYHDVIVQLSNNTDFSTGVTTIFNNDTDNSAGLGTGTNSEYIETSDGKDISFSAVNARYVRFYTNGNTKNGYNHYCEVEIYDGVTNIQTPPSPPPPTTTPPPPVPVTSSNLAAGKLAASSVYFTGIGMTTDGDKNVNNYANSTPNIGLQWVQLDLGASYNVNDIRLWHYYGGVRSYHDVIVQLSNNTDFSSGVTTVFNNDTDNSSGFGIGTDSEYTETSNGKDISFSAVNARYVRFYSNGNTSNGYNHYVEIEIYDGVTNTQTAEHKAKLLFTFDDGAKEVFTIAAPILYEKGFKGTAYVGENIPLQYWMTSLMDVSDLEKLYSFYGWDLGNHTVNHLRIGSNTDAASLEILKQEYLDNQNWLISNAWIRGAYQVAFPYGYFSDQLIEILKEIGVKTARTTIGGLETTPIEDPYKLTCIDVMSGVNNVKSAIDSAISQGSTVILMLHGINDTAGDWVIKTSDFQEIVDYASQYYQQDKLEVTTMSEWYNSIK